MFRNLAVSGWAGRRSGFQNRRRSPPDYEAQEATHHSELLLEIVVRPVRLAKSFINEMIRGLPTIQVLVNQAPIPALGPTRSPSVRLYRVSLSPVWFRKIGFRNAENLEKRERPLPADTLFVAEAPSEVRENTTAVPDLSDSLASSHRHDVGPDNPSRDSPSPQPAGFSLPSTPEGQLLAPLNEYLPDSRFSIPCLPSYGREHSRRFLPRTSQS